MPALLLVLACSGGPDTVTVPDTATSMTGIDTGETRTADTAETGDSTVHTGDSAPGTTDTAETGATGDTGDTGEPIDTTPPPWCPVIADPVEIGRVVDEELDELSGVVESRQQPGVLWTHNDSGDTGRIFALDRSGALLGIFEIDGRTPRDLEDLSWGLGPDGEEHYLYLGDVGDNSRVRETVRAFRLPEPILDLKGELPVAGVVSPEPVEFEFHDGVIRDSESTFVDPLNGDFYLVVKDRNGLGISGVFRAEAPFGREGTGQLIEVHELLFGGVALPGSDLATGADISPDGEWILIRTYSSAFLWWRDPARPLWEAFQENACPVPVASEPQGEAIGFAANGRDYLTLSERVDQPVWLYSWQD